LVAAGTAAGSKRLEREAPGKRKGGGGQPQQQKRADLVSLQREGMDLLVASARPAQRLARAQRQRAAALEHAVLLPLDHVLVAPMQQQEDRWHQARRGQLAAGGTKMDMPGGLSLYLWAAAVTTMAGHSAGEKEDREMLKNYGKKIGKVEDLHEGVSNCWLTRTYDKAHFKLVVLVAAELQPVAGALLRTLRATGGQVLHGPPPPSAEERQATRLLTRLAPG